MTTNKEKAIEILKDDQENVDFEWLKEEAQDIYDAYDLAISAIKKVDKIEKIIDDLEVDKIDAIKASEHIRAIIDEEE